MRKLNYVVEDILKSRYLNNILNEQLAGGRIALPREIPFVRGTAEPGRIGEAGRIAEPRLPELQKMSFEELSRMYSKEGPTELKTALATALRSAAEKELSVLMTQNETAEQVFTQFFKKYPQAQDNPEIAKAMEQAYATMQKGTLPSAPGTIPQPVRARAGETDQRFPEWAAKVSMPKTGAPEGIKWPVDLVKFPEGQKLTPAELELLQGQVSAPKAPYEKPKVSSLEDQEKQLLLQKLAAEQEAVKRGSEPRNPTNPKYDLKPLKVSDLIDVEKLTAKDLTFKPEQPEFEPLTAQPLSPEEIIKRGGLNMPADATEADKETRQQFKLEDLLSPDDIMALMKKFRSGDITDKNDIAKMLEKLQKEHGLKTPTEYGRSTGGLNMPADSELGTTEDIVNNIMNILFGPKGATPEVEPQPVPTTVPTTPITVPPNYLPPEPKPGWSPIQVPKWPWQMPKPGQPRPGPSAPPAIPEGPPEVTPVEPATPTVPETPTVQPEPSPVIVPPAKPKPPVSPPPDEEEEETEKPKPKTPEEPKTPPAPKPVPAPKTPPLAPPAAPDEAPKPGEKGKPDPFTPPYPFPTTPPPSPKPVPYLPIPLKSPWRIPPKPPAPPTVTPPPPSQTTPPPPNPQDKNIKDFGFGFPGGGKPAPEPSGRADQIDIGLTRKGFGGTNLAGYYKIR